MASSTLARLRALLIKCGGPGSGRTGPCPQGSHDEPAAGYPPKPPKPSRLKPQRVPMNAATAVSGAQARAARIGRLQLPPCAQKAAVAATKRLYQSAARKLGKEEARLVAAVALVASGAPATVGELLALAGLAALCRTPMQPPEDADMGKTARRAERFAAALAERLEGACPGDREALKQILARLGKKQQKSLDAQGGEKPVVGRDSLERADFITYPEDVRGSNCSNCMHEEHGACTFHDAAKGIDLRGQPVNERNCCILPGTLVAGVFVASSRAQYSGQAVRVTTAAGRSVSLTINHPVFTEHGFVAAGLLKQGDNLVGHALWGKPLGAADNVDDQPPAVEDVFEAILFCCTGTSGKGAASPLDFHGDGQFIKGNIDIVSADGFLRSASHPETPQGADDQTLSGADLGEGSFPAHRFKHSRLVATRTVSGRIVSGLDLSLSSLRTQGSPLLRGNGGQVRRPANSLVGSEVGVPFGEGNTSLLQPPTEDNSGPCKASPYEFVVSPKEVCNLPEALAGLVERDQVVEVICFHYEGPVYDFETNTGFIIAEGLLISNCAFWDAPGTLRDWQKRLVRLRCKRLRLKTDDRRGEPRVDEPAADRRRIALPVKRGSPPPDIVIVRHGETDLNGKGSLSPEALRGHIDVPLNDAGRADARRTAKMLAASGATFHKLYTSDLQRASATAETIQKALAAAGQDLEIHATRDLRPWDAGDLAGKPIAQVKDDLDYYAEHTDESPPGGEPFDEFLARYHGFLDRVTADFKPTLLLVAHTRNQRVAAAWADVKYVRAPLLEGKFLDVGEILGLWKDDDGWQVAQWEPEGEAEKALTRLRQILKTDDREGHHHAPAGKPEGGQFTAGNEGGGGKKPKRPAATEDARTEPGIEPANRTAPNPTSPKQPRRQREFENRQDLQRSLRRSATATSEPTTAAGINGSYVIQTEDGTLGVFKPASEEGYLYPGQEDQGRQDVRRGIRKGTYFKREVAASRVAEVLGMDDLVPATTFRRDGKEVGSAQAYVDDAVPAALLAEPFDGDEDLARAAVMDYLLASTDRHFKNWMLQKGKKLQLIDNGLCLPESVHENDFVTYDRGKGEYVLGLKEQVIGRAAEKNLPLPDLSSWAEKWPRVEKALASSGVRGEAARLARERFESLLEIHGQGGTVADLPDYLDVNREGRTLGGRFGPQPDPAADVPTARE